MKKTISSKLKKELERVKTELWLLYEISNAMRTTLKLPEILYVILTAVTYHGGLGFNRAMLFLANEKNTDLIGVMGIGPTDSKEAQRIWKHIAKEGLNLIDLIKKYHKIEHLVTNSHLNALVKSMQIPLNEKGGILANAALEGMSFKITTKKIKDKMKDYFLDKLNSYPCVCVPLKGQFKTVGVLLVDNMITKKNITKDDTRILTMIADQAGLALENSFLYEQARLQANVDSLTNIWNHGYFQYQLKNIINENLKTKKIFSIAMIDLDNFKSYNDKFGHQKGDAFLKNISSVFKANIRKQDMLCRYGGEEFALIMPSIKKQDAYSIIERLREMTEQIFLKSKPANTMPLVSISSGIATFPYDGKTKSILIKKADKALYKAKQGGKNKTLLA